MTLQLVKEFDKKGEISYHVTVDGEAIPETVCYDLQEAMMIYEVEKKKVTKARTLVLIQEEV